MLPNQSLLWKSDISRSVPTFFARSPEEAVSDSSAILVYKPTLHLFSFFFMVLIHN